MNAVLYGTLSRSYRYQIRYSQSSEGEEAYHLRGGGLSSEGEEAYHLRGRRPII